VSDTSLLDWALFYVRQGLSIIPISPKEKIPLVLWKDFQGRQASEEEIKKWWETWPTADIGCITGPISKRLILDIDGEDGRKSVSSYAIPVTATTRTLRGLQHHFKYPDGLTAKTTIGGLLPGVDVRGAGGYCKLPPSCFSDNSGRYAWENEESLAEAPPWLIELLDKRDYLTAPTSPQVLGNTDLWIEETLQGVGEGDRHGALLKLFGYYANTMPLDLASAHIREWNKNNQPPMSPDRLEATLKDLTERFQKGEYTSTFVEKIKAQPRNVSLLSATQLVTQYNKPPKFLVPGLIPQNTRTIFAGWQGRGKSFITTDLVIEIARKKGYGKWLGEFDVAHGPVIYVDNENARNLASHRLSQLLAPKGLQSNDLDLHFVIGNHLKLSDERDYLWLKEQIAKVKPVLVVIDSLASCHTLDENSSKDTRYFFDELILPLCEEYGCGMLFIHHENKGTPGVQLSGGKRVRGSSAHGDAVDQIISLNEKDGVVFLEHSKRRYTKKHPDFAISIEENSSGFIVRNSGYL